MSDRRSIDHVTIRVTDYERSRAFYNTVLTTLGIERGFEDEALRITEWGDFSIAGDGKPVSANLHVGFAARSRSEVEAFHRAGVDWGAADNGAPGERPIYHPGYYGAFLLDPDDNNVEAVFHDRTGES